MFGSDVNTAHVGIQKTVIRLHVLKRKEMRNNLLGTEVPILRQLCRQLQKYEWFANVILPNSFPI